MCDAQPRSVGVAFLQVHVSMLIPHHGTLHSVIIALGGVSRFRPLHPR